MDPLSQAVVGVTFSVSFCRKKNYVRPAVIAAIVGGMLPDADILIRSAADPLLSVEYHRHFTHSLAFIPFGGLIATLLCWPVLRKQLSFLRLYLFATLGFATHGVLDAMTNYGTHLLWPFTNYRESWSIISIVDPVFTLTLLALCGLAYRLQARRYTIFAAVFALLYWSFGYLQRERATDAMMTLAESRGHVVERSEVKPSFGNLIVWRAQYEYAGQYYMDAVRVMPFADTKWYYGASLPAFDMKRDLPQLPMGSMQHNDIARFVFFSDGWLAWADAEKTVLGDVRFSTLPQQTRPLWGIKLSPDAPESHVGFVHFPRQMDGAFATLWQMISGHDIQ
ncbi:MAG: metal-dependent hydrolase [Alphaproteobacteria bacterium]|jgi:inner membrane protein